MHAARINFLRHTVVPHLEKMPTLADLPDVDYEEPEKYNKACANTAVFDLDQYIVHSVIAGEMEEDPYLARYDYYDMVNNHDDEKLDKISSAYECGFRGCFAGWYVLLARKHEFLSSSDVYFEGLQGYCLNKLAAHFEISFEQAEALFRTLGAGCEDSLDGTAAALECRVQFLDNMIKEHADESVEA
jgi:hypothetical protein